MSETYRRYDLGYNISEVMTSCLPLTTDRLQRAVDYFNRRRGEGEMPIRREETRHIWEWPQDWREGVWTTSEAVRVDATCGICGKKIQKEDNMTFDNSFCYHTSCYEDFVYIKPHHKEKEE